MYYNCLLIDATMLKKAISQSHPPPKKKNQRIFAPILVYTSQHYLGYIFIFFFYYHRVYLLLGECYMVFQTWDYLQNKLNVLSLDKAEQFYMYRKCYRLAFLWLLARHQALMIWLALYKESHTVQNLLAAG